MSQPKNIDMTSHSGRHILLSADLWIPIVVLTLTTVLFNRYDWDLQIQAAVYNGSWYLGNLGWVRLLYHYGNIPALLVSVGALIALFLSYRRVKLLPYRKLFAYLALAMVLGPGLIVNTIFKDHWGRPRPRDIVEFGGKYAYEAPLRMEPESSGKSFPCGHATMGFYFFSLGFALRHRRPRLSRVMFILATILGTMIGAARVLQGGHFTSDVIWAGGMIYLCSLLLWRIMKLHLQPLYAGEIKPQPRLGKLQTIGLVFAGLLLILGVNLATPYSSNREFVPAAEAGTRLALNLRQADVTLAFTEQSLFKTEVSGFGFPGSKVRFNRLEGAGILGIEQNISGYFTELSCRVSAQIDTTVFHSFCVELESGEVTLMVPQSLVDTVYVNPDCIIGDHDSALMFRHVNADSASRIRIVSPKINVINR